MGRLDRSANVQVPGLNHNIRYKDRVFHVQTECGGPGQLDIHSHLFLGGKIVGSLKTRAEAGQSDVTVSMQAQHRAIARALVAGQHDEAIARLDTQGVYAPGVLAGGLQAQPPLVGGSESSGSLKPLTKPAEVVVAASTPPAPASTRQPKSPDVRSEPRLADAMSDDIIVRHLLSEPED